MQIRERQEMFPARYEHNPYCLTLECQCRRALQSSAKLFAIAAVNAATTIAPGTPETTAPINAPVVGASIFNLCKACIAVRIRLSNGVP